MGLEPPVKGPLRPILTVCASEKLAVPHTVISSIMKPTVFRERRSIARNERRHSEVIFVSL
jgi:hypothetical protein